MGDEDLSAFDSGPPLKKQDVLFRTPHDWEGKGNVAVGQDDWIYSRGFRLAAQRLAKQVPEAGTEQGMLVYPIVYLYRHHAELVLKAIIRSASRALGRELTELERNTLGSHHLEKLWRAARPMLNPVCERAGDPLFSVDELEGVDSYIRQIHERDSSGQGFRYATKKAKRGDPADSLIPSLGPDFWQVNVTALTVSLEKLSDYLEGIEWRFCEVEDAKADVERMYGK